MLVNVLGEPAMELLMNVLGEPAMELLMNAGECTWRTSNGIADECWWMYLENQQWNCWWMLMNVLGEPAMELLMNADACTRRTSNGTGDECTRRTSKHMLQNHWDTEIQTRETTACILIKVPWLHILVYKTENACCKKYDVIQHCCCVSITLVCVAVVGLELVWNYSLKDHQISLRMMKGLIDWFLVYTILFD